MSCLPLPDNRPLVTVNHQPYALAVPRVALIAITKNGVQQAALLARQLPAASLCVTEKFEPLLAGVTNPVYSYNGPTRDEIAGFFDHFDQLVFFISLGAVVRLIAPHLKSKHQDPGVTVVDEAGHYVIPVLSGHVGGANAYALHIAQLLGGTAVLTTASDVGQTIPVDVLGHELGWVVESPKINITRASAAVVNDEPVALIQEAGSPHWWTRPTPLPTNIHPFTRFEDVDLDQFKAVLWITHAEVTPAHWAQLHERLVVYRPPQGQGA